MMSGVRELVAMLSEQKLVISEVREKAQIIDEAESLADRLVAAAERMLVSEYIEPTANHLEFIAWGRLYQLLEEMTDEANHCGELILSLARKET
jgi:uncharacterized protein Yka (UPF0111/DUF47 family)